MSQTSAQGRKTIAKESDRSNFLLFAAAFLILSTGAALATDTPKPAIPWPILSITAADLKGDLSFLASDVLQGRYTPSPGLEVAAEFIAAQFRRAGLRPAGDDGYFQTAHMVDVTMAKAASGLEVHLGTQDFTIPPESLQILHATRAQHIDRLPVLALTSSDPASLKNVDLTGKAVVVARPDFGSMPHQESLASYSKWEAFQATLSKSALLLEVMVSKSLSERGPQLTPAAVSSPHKFPLVAITGPLADRLLSSTAEESTTLSMEIPAPQKQPAKVKNVIAILPGSDPSLKGTYVLLTAHYDHIGTTETSKQLSNPASTPNPDDLIYNGANDDGSGTVSVMEIGRALSKVSPRPRRSIVFMLFFGEERGERGSAYYVLHPVFPIQKTVADINLEQVGRTDELTDGKIVPQLNAFSLTGFDYSNISSYMIRAGRQLGVKVFKDDQASDEYFTQSDNAALAEQGIPAHSISVAYDFPDYHGVGDEWQKIDYQNMARVDRVIALAVLRIANSTTAPKWAEGNPKTEIFRAAQARQSAETPSK